MPSIPAHPLSELLLTLAGLALFTGMLLCAVLYLARRDAQRHPEAQSTKQPKQPDPL